MLECHRDSVNRAHIICARRRDHAACFNRAASDGGTRSGVECLRHRNFHRALTSCPPAHHRLSARRRSRWRSHVINDSSRQECRRQRTPLGGAAFPFPTSLRLPRRSFPLFVAKRRQALASLACPLHALASLAPSVLLRRREAPIAIPPRCGLATPALAHSTRSRRRFSTQCDTVSYHG